MHFDVAIIIVTYNSEKQIAACLLSVTEQRLQINQQIIVLDNHSSDRTREIINDRFPSVRLISSAENLGFARGVNTASRLANADYILLLNPDTVILDHAIDKIVAFARRYPANRLYGGRSIKPDGTLEPSSCWGRPTLWSLAMFALCLSSLAKNNRLFNPESLGNWQRDSIREVDVVTGCFLLVDRKIWEDLRGLDERYFMYGEDTDFSMRSHLVGCRPLHCPEATIIHEVGQSSSTPIHKMLLLYRGKASYFRTHYSGLSKSIALGFLLGGVALRAGLYTILHRFNSKAITNDWKTVWSRRNEWLGGYPMAAPLPTLLRDEHQ